MTNYQDTCVCGVTKDQRAKQCRTCWRARSSSDDGSSLCVSCKLWKSSDDFRSRSRNKDGLEYPRSICKACEAADAAEHRKEHPDRHAQAKRDWEEKNHELHEKQLLRSKARVLGLDPKMIVTHFESHHGLCDLCGQPPTGVKKNGRPRVLAIDHCHTSGEFRGLLCTACNLGLGMFRDDPDLMRRAADYVTR